MNTLTKKLTAIGATAVIAVSGGVLVGPWENRENHAYKDMVGIVSICYGETKVLKMGDYRTDEQCDESLAKELESYNKAMKKYVKVPLKPYEEVAYTSLVWNIGETAFKNSKSVLVNLNAGNNAAACKGILDWNKATFTARAASVQIRNGEKCTTKSDGMFSCTVKGLTNRRADEFNTCIGNNAKVNEALHELSTTQNTLGTFNTLSTSIGINRPGKAAVEPVDSLPEPVENESHIVPIEQEPIKPVECSFKLFGLCFNKR